jgi:hypothetical protein
LKYHHTEAGPLNDFFSFDVTNGLQTLRKLEFVMEIIPSYLELDIQNLTVKEGGKVPLSHWPIHCYHERKIFHHSEEILR